MICILWVHLYNLVFLGGLTYELQRCIFKNIPTSSVSVITPHPLLFWRFGPCGLWPPQSHSSNFFSSLLPPSSSVSGANLWDPSDNVLPSNSRSSNVAFSSKTTPLHFRDTSFIRRHCVANQLKSTDKPQDKPQLLSALYWRRHNNRWQTHVHT